MPFITDEPALLAYLDEHDIPYTRYTHPAVFTCAEVALVDLPIEGVETKNLFLRDGKGRFYLVMTACEKRVNLKRLSQSAGAPKLHFAAEAELMERLGLTPGSVTVLALVNDPAQRVTLLVDSQYWPAPAYLCHPMVNTATLALAMADLERFFALTGHTPQVVEMEDL